LVYYFTRLTACSDELLSIHSTLISFLTFLFLFLFLIFTFTPKSGLDYTILHPGGLVGDTPGGQEEFVLDVDDNLYKMNNQNRDHDPDHENSNSNSKNRQSHRSMTRISREDVAELCVAALSVGKGGKISFDCITLPSSTVSSMKTMATATTEGIDGGGAGVGDDRTNKNNIESSTSTATSTTMAATATASAISTTTTIGRKSAEETLTEFLELSITTNYDI
jgi:hypothetical protein